MRPYSNAPGLQGLNARDEKLLQDSLWLVEFESDFNTFIDQDKKLIF